MGFDQKSMKKQWKYMIFLGFSRGSPPGLWHFPENSHTNGWSPYDICTMQSWFGPAHGALHELRTNIPYGVQRRISCRFAWVPGASDLTRHCLSLIAFR